MYIIRISINWEWPAWLYVFKSEYFDIVNLGDKAPLFHGRAYLVSVEIYPWDRNLLVTGIFTPATWKQNLFHAMHMTENSRRLEWRNDCERASEWKILRYVRSSNRTSSSPLRQRPIIIC